MKSVLTRNTLKLYYNISDGEKVITKTQSLSFFKPDVSDETLYELAKNVSSLINPIIIKVQKNLVAELMEE